MMQPMHYIGILCFCFSSWCRGQWKWPHPSQRVSFVVWSATLRTGQRWTGWPCSEVLHDRSGRVHAQTLCLRGETFYGDLCCSKSGSVPADEDALCHFAATLAEEGLRHKTIKSYMAGVRHLHISEGHGDPFSGGLHRLHYILRGVLSVLRAWLG